MTGPAAVLVALFLSLGPNGHLLHPVLTADSARAALPTAPLVDVLPSLWLVPHDQEALAMAFYAPRGGAGSPSMQEAERLAALLGAELPERLLPGLNIPRVFVYAPYYFVDDGIGGRLKSIESMPLDVSEYLFNALWEAWLDLALDSTEPDYAAHLAERAEDLMISAPPDQRREAYLSALGDFASHAFSVAGELRRVLARARARGRDPCPAIDLPTTLYGLWPKIFTDHGYVGGYYAPHSGARDTSAPWTSKQWITTRESLAEEDKKLFTDAVWDGFWTGDVRRDFALTCP